MRRFAVIVSAVLHPMLMPLGSVFVAWKFDWYVYGQASEEMMRMVFLVVALSTIAFPAINILLLRWYGVLTSLETPKRKERNGPFISTFFFFVLGYYMLRKAILPSAIYAIMLGCMAALLILSLVNLRWKISAHAAGVAGLVGVVFGLFRIHDFANTGLMAIALLALGLVLTARLILKAHQPAQVYAGAAVGFLCTFFSVSTGLFI
ncbi:MAG TPA: hypothetical protein VJ911_10465 [Cryomorphaceae bacterium]|nr:hypothetical protein [Cryomorphaceae bacterium]